jgi:hypothetical protein
MHTLRRRVFATAEPKMLEGTPLSGAMLVALAESYVGAVNGGHVPSIKDAWTNVCDSECRNKARAGIEAFKDMIRKLERDELPMCENALRERLGRESQTVVDAFRAATETMGREAEEHAKRLAEEMRALQERTGEVNQRKAAEKVEVLLRDLFGDLEERLARGLVGDWPALET